MAGFVGAAYKAIFHNDPSSSRPPAGASPTSPAAAGVVPPGAVPPGAVPYGHGAGYRVPPADLAKPTDQAPTAVVPVKAHLRNVPAQPAAEKSLIAGAVTLEMLVAEFRRAQRISTQRVLLLGALCERWVRQQLAARTALDRATAIKKIREELAAAKLEKKECRVDLYIRCHAAAVLLGKWEAESHDSRQASNELAFSALRLFPLLIERKGNTWQLIPAHAEAARALWARAIAEKLSAHAVDEEITRILPARTIAIKRRRPVRLSMIEKLLARLKPEDLPKVHGLVDQVSAKLGTAAA